MRVLIAGGRGFLGGALGRALRASGHEVVILTRSKRLRSGELHWSEEPFGDWARVLGTTDAVVNACGYGLEHWPWTSVSKRRFVTSRVQPGLALASAVDCAKPRPRVFVQFSGINRYGLSGASIADESTPAAHDFLAQLTISWEAATRSLEARGVRHVVVRNAIVLDALHGLFPLMTLPCKLLMGGRFGSGKQAVPWIHLADHVRAVKHLLEDGGASGPYNLVAPATTTNEEFMRAVCLTLHRPFWFHIPAAILRLALGEMAVLVLGGRFSWPRRLLEAGLSFGFPTLESALADLLGSGRRATSPRA